MAVAVSRKASPRPAVRRGYRNRADCGHRCVSYLCHHCYGSLGAEIIPRFASSIALNICMPHPLRLLDRRLVTGVVAATMSSHGELSQEEYCAYNVALTGQIFALGGGASSVPSPQSSEAPRALGDRTLSTETPNGEGFAETASNRRLDCEAVCSDPAPARSCYRRQIHIKDSQDVHVTVVS